MKQRKRESDCVESKTEEVVVVVPRPPPPPPPLPKFPVFSRPRVEESMTKREIAKFWRQKWIEEQDHLLSAIKAAAKLRARNRTEQDYLSFQESLENERDEDDDLKRKSLRFTDARENQNDAQHMEVRVGIKDWWTKSNYAYLNQPALDSMEPPKKRASSYTPNCLSYKPKPMYPTSIGVF